MPRRNRSLGLCLSLCTTLAGGIAGFGWGGPSVAFAHGGAYQPPAGPPPIERPPHPGPTTGGPGNSQGPTTPGGGGSGPVTPGGRDIGPTTGGGSDIGPTTPGGGGSAGPTTPGTGGPVTGGPVTGGPGKAPAGTGPVTPGGASGTGPLTPGGGIQLPTRRTLPPSSDALPDPHHWSRWWYSQRAVLVGLETHAARAGASTPSATDPNAEMWRADAQRALAKALSDDDEDIASAAAIALGKHGDPADAPALLAVVRDGRRAQPVREAAALGLGLLGTSGHPASREATRVLMDAAAKDSEPERLRAICVWSLGLRRDLAAVPFLLDVAASRGETDDLRGAAVSALGLSGCDLALEPLTGWLEGTRGQKKHETVRRVHAAHALAHLGDPRALPVLRAACRDDDEDVRRAAALAIGALAKSDDEESALVLARMLDKDRDDGVRNTAAIALGRTGSALGEKSLRYAYEKGDSTGQCFAALGLGLYARTTNAPGILGELRSDLKTRANADLRGALAISLGLARDRSAAKTLRALLEEKGDSVLRGYVAMALGMIGDAQSADALREMLADTRDPLLRRETAAALGLLGDFRAVAVLQKLVEDGSSLFVQGSAAVALGRIGGGEAAKTLAGMLGDAKRPSLSRGMAAVGLGCLLDREAGRGLGRVGAHLNWYFRTDSVDEVLTIL